PQYSLLRAVASLQGSEGVSIGIVAEHLHVTSAFITAQSAALAQRSLLKKKEDAADRRISRISLTPTGERLVNEIVNEVRPINDIFFGGLQKAEFDALSAIMEKLVDCSRYAIVRISSEDQQALLSIRDRRVSPRNRLCAAAVLSPCFNLKILSVSLLRRWRREGRCRINSRSSEGAVAAR